MAAIYCFKFSHFVYGKTFAMAKLNLSFVGSLKVIHQSIRQMTKFKWFRFIASHLCF